MHTTAGQCNAVKKGSLRAVHYQDTVQCNVTKGRATETLKAMQKKSSLKYINMGSSFEDLDATNTTMKTEVDLDAWFERYRIFRI